ncbi:hypothetical protein HK414_04865 [Ramlibacter terrae]|uniref:Uncharacterized protein n=1 Tax=Ramlibacter terrae TaxID=2732511 RepID=A0ABX6P0R0_9BURK|nr:hypothetical protein HK414_04865 [Ramlibacter terrae]
MAKNTAWTITILGGYSYCAPSIYSAAVLAAGAVAPGPADPQLAWAGYMALVCTAAALACLLPFRLGLASGAMAAEVFWDVARPFVGFITFAQSRLAGIPMTSLAAGYVRIDDRSAWCPVCVVPSTQATLSAKPSHRHSVCVTEPGVWSRIGKLAAGQA